MKKFILVLLAWLAGIPTCASAEEAPCKMQRLAHLQLYMEDDGPILVPVTFEGRDTWMLLAMSQGLPMLFAESVPELQLTKRLMGTKWQATSGGEKVRHEVKAKSVKLGGADFTGWSFLIGPGKTPELAYVDGKPIIGTMSSIFMNAVDMELNLASKEISLFKHKECRGKPVFWPDDFTDVKIYADETGLLLFPMELDGIKVEASLSTQSKTSKLSSMVSRRYFGFDEDSPGIVKEAASAGRSAASYRAMALTAKGLNIKNTQIELVSTDDCRVGKGNRNTDAVGFVYCLNRTPLILGADLLRKLRVYIASGESRAYFRRVNSVAVSGVTAPAAAPSPSAGAENGAASQ
jgi:hypothetical protein